MMLPAFVRLRVQHWPTLWLPLFLCWPLVMVLLVLTFAVGYALDVSHPKGPRVRASERWSSLWQVLCATRGLRVDIGGPTQFGISIH